jgi:hypothetical protein
MVTVLLLIFPADVGGTMLRTYCGLVLVEKNEDYFTETELTL